VGFAEADEDRAALLVLLNLASMTAKRLLDLAQDCETSSKALAAVKAGRAGSEADRALANSLKPADLAPGVRAAGATLVPVHDPAYPVELLDLFDPPAGLFVRGGFLQAGRARVAIVGARNCSPSGREIATALGRALAGVEACVVSGLARGIDAAAHLGALRAGGPTIGVLGCGIDVAYPSQNRYLMNSIASLGAVVSEYPPGVRPEPFRFPARNRLVAALSSAVVVVEGAQGSGSMITADHALDIGRDVFAVPGSISTALAHVPLALIREGATLIRGPDDLLEDLGLKPFAGGDPNVAQADAASGESLPAPLRDPIASALWAGLSTPMTPDGLAAVTGLDLSAVMAGLLRLELRAFVRHVGGRYERCSFPSAPC